MAQRKRHEITHGGKTVYVYGETVKVQRFFPDAEEAAEADATVKTVLFRAGTRRRFPGGPTYSSGGGSRRVVVGGPPNMQTLPGNPIKCEVTTGVGPLKRTDVFQFTLSGPFTTLWEAAKATSTETFVLRSPNGKGKPIGPAVVP